MLTGAVEYFYFFYMLSSNFSCLWQRFTRFFQENYNRKLCDEDQSEFLNGWYLLIIVSDLLAIVGSILKMEIQAKVMHIMRILIICCLV